MTIDLRRAPAREFMNPTVHWAAAHENLRAAAVRMEQNGLRALLVAGDGPNDLPGIVTSKDIVNLLGSQDPAALDQLQVTDVMTRPAFCVTAPTSVRDCINLMRMAGVRRVPVVDGTTVIGVLSASDVFRRCFGAPTPRPGAE
jgi:CBS domain-containing protein